MATMMNDSLLYVLLGLILVEKRPKAAENANVSMWLAFAMTIFLITFSHACLNVNHFVSACIPKYYI